MMTILKRLKRCWKRSNSHRHTLTAAALAFYSLISLVPILITGVSIAAWLVDEETAKESLLDGTSSVAGSNVANYFAELLSKDIQWTGSGLSPIIGGLFLIFSATKMLAELRKSLTRIFGPLDDARKAKALQTLMNRGVSVVLLLCLGILIACLVVAQTLFGMLVSATDGVIAQTWLVNISAPILSFIAVGILCSIAIRWLPQNPPSFKIALRGGAVSALLLAVLKVGLTLILKHADIGSYYGSALTLVLVLFWIYFAMQAFLFGAEYAAGLAREHKTDEAENDTKTAET